MYLNTINYGSGAYGIEAASQRYFSKHASELTLAEAAALIGIPQSPTYNNPIDHEDNCLARRNLVLDRMLTNGYITRKSTMPPRRRASCSTRPRPRWIACRSILTSAATCATCSWIPTATIVIPTMSCSKAA